MKPLILIDSNIIIALLRLRRNPLSFLSATHLVYQFATCEMVMLEVLRGIRESAALRSMEKEFLGLTYLPMDRSTWRIARSLAWELERAGLPTKAPDILIAACALESQAIVLTKDQDFFRIPNLKVVSTLG